MRELSVTVRGQKKTSNASDVELYAVRSFHTSRFYEWSLKSWGSILHMKPR